MLLEAGHVRSASLVLGAAREHRSAAIALVPNAQRKAFTLLQAARLAAFLQAEGVSAPAGLTGEERLAWWVDELDAVRGDAPRVDAREDDLPDPHEDGARHERRAPAPGGRRRTPRLRRRLRARGRREDRPPSE